MKHKIFWIVGVCLSLTIVLAILFMSVGGMQMLPQSTIPIVDPPYSLESDLAFLGEVVVSNESHLTQEQLANFEKVLARAGSITTADELSLIASQALAVFNNAHTTVLKPEMRRLPLRFHWTSDGLIVVKSTQEFSNLLGHRISRLGNKTPEEMLSKVKLVVGGGTKAWQRYRSEYYFSAPSALSLFGADVESYTLSIESESPNGEVLTHIITASEETMPGDPFWDFLDSFPNNSSFGTEGWVTLLTQGQSLPLYLQQTEQLHSFHLLSDYSALYMRMNASFDDEDISINELISRAVEGIDSVGLKNAVVDFRFNRGGDYTKVLPLVKVLSKSIPDDGQIYLIVGPNTFSAGIIASSQFKRYAPDKLTVVGSEMGDKLRFKAEGFYPKLPHTGIQLYLTRGWTDLIQGCGWFDDCWPPNKILLRKIGILTIDIPVENNWESYRNGRDLVVEAIISDIKTSNQL